VKHTCDVALAERVSLTDALFRDQGVASRVDRAAIEQMTNPAHYPGSADAFVDCMLQAARGIA
jgi:3-carboxy-cis,cis-muconate cycloisomerase